ncbi:hypothetical protein M0R45_006169 [Rubus argutus]|uniref:Uncharacterized protein n=1 Tax=Rubus argutus TaxID=59490 RepID=A0AAW1YQ52_RUBAR
MGRVAAGAEGLQGRKGLSRRGSWAEHGPRDGAGVADEASNGLRGWVAGTNRARARVGIVDEIANLSAPTSGLLTTVEKRCGDADAGRGEVGRRRERELVRRWRTEHGLGSKTRSEDSCQIGKLMVVCICDEETGENRDGMKTEKKGRLFLTLLMVKLIFAALVSLVMQWMRHNLTCISRIQILLNDDSPSDNEDEDPSLVSNMEAMADA